jgi:hypothetical protein
MRGLLADVNVQGHSLYLRRLLQSLDLWDLLIELGLIFATFRDFRLPGDLDDRTLWSFCQREGWVLFTANRNDEGPNSLHATLMESWIEGSLPVLTLANKVTFERDRAHAERVAADVAELLFGIAQLQYRDQARIYVPRR